MKKALSFLVVFALLQYSSGQLLMLDLTADSEVNEGNFGTPITISLVSGIRPGDDVVITFMLSGNATAGMDYQAPADFTYTPFGNNDQSFNLAISEDSIAEPSETIILTASVSMGSAQFSTDTVTIILNDDDVPFFELNTTNVVESAGSAVVIVELRSTELAFDVAVTVVTVLGTATAGDDYTATSVVLIFLSGSVEGATQNVSIPIINDTIVENTEVFDVELVLGARPPLATGNIAIYDDDNLTVAFEQSEYSVDEDAGPREVCVVITANMLADDLSAQVGVSSANLDAQDSPVPIADYGTIESQIVIFPASSGVGARQCIDVPIVDDVLVEDTESFRLDLVLISGQPVILGTPDSTIVSILDNDQLECRFTQSNYNVVEGNTAVITVQLLGGHGSDVTKQVSCSGDTAEPGDFTDPSPVTLSFPASMTDTTRDVLVPTLDDDFKEADETIICTVTITDSGQQEIEFPDGNSTTITILDNDVCTIGFIPPPGEPPFVGVPSYPVPEGSGPARIHVGIIAGGIESPREAVVTLTISDNTAEDPLDYNGAGDIVLTFDSTTPAIWLDIPIIDDDLCENDETIDLMLTTSSPDVNLDPATGEIIIIDDDVATVGTDQPSYTVDEFEEDLYFNVSIIAGQKAPGRQCEIQVGVVDDTATGGEDYVQILKTVILDDTVTSEQCHIDIVDDLDCEPNERFYISLIILNGNCAAENNGSIPVTILDDEDCCDPDPCHPRAICDELPGPDNFTCTCIPPLMGDGFMCVMDGVGDDPHFSIALPGGKLLCYTVQGEHGFTFNLISNEMVFMNAMFVPDSRRDEVTWLGSMGIIVKSGYRKSNSTALRFEALEKKIYINDKVVLEPRNVERLTFSNGKLTISEAPPMEGFKYPKVYVDLQDAGLSFSIQFLAEHLDLFWHSTGQQTENSHGIIGQFFRKGVELDEVRKILIMPNKEPVPVMRRPVWSFMERELPDNQLCWTAMNPGYQGERLIDGTYFDYLVNDVLSTDFTFKKQQ